ncbi:DNA-binding barrel domain superfamily [Sesbania bispinosa]|nr:DNA-binding barrel domain superfamily [Sesbania bispinosa]
MQNELGKRIELFDNSDQRFTVLLRFGNKSVVMWELAEDLKRVYNFNKTVYMYLNYEGGKTFRFDLRDEESNVTLTPALAYRSGRNGGGDTENQSGLVNASVGSRVKIFQKNTGIVNEHVKKRIISFEKVISKSQSQGGQTLPLPRNFVREFIREYWTELMLHVGDGQTYTCTLLRRKRRELDCHLGKPWTSWSDKNPGRRYVRCPNKAAKNGHGCNYFDWLDGPNETHQPLPKCNEKESANETYGCGINIQMLNEKLKSEIASVKVRVIETRRRIEILLITILVVIFVIFLHW